MCIRDRYASNRRLIEVIEFTNETLAGIPSIIYGLVGMLVFSQALGFQTCLLSGSLTLVVMNLPTIIRTTVSYTHLDVYKRQIFPRPGEVFPQSGSPWQSTQTSSLCQGLSLWERWHGVSRDGEV